MEYWYAFFTLALISAETVMLFVADGKFASETLIFICVPLFIVPGIWLLDASKICAPVKVVFKVINAFVWFDFSVINPLSY